MVCLTLTVLDMIAGVTMAYGLVSDPGDQHGPVDGPSEPFDGNCSPGDANLDVEQPVPTATASPDHPELAFVQAKSYARGRPDGPPIWIVVHDMEASETPTRAENTANYFATLPDGRSVSSHYCADNDSVVQCVRLADTAFTVGNRPGNYRGINWEFSGFASQTRAQWLDAFGVAMFDQAAPIIRSDAQRYGIPLVRRTVAELRSFVPGVASHHDLGIAFGGTTHTDPGPNFPWDYFMALIQGGGTMTEQNQHNADAHGFALTHLLPEYNVYSTAGAPPGTATTSNPFAELLRSMDVKLDEVLAKPGVVPAPVDVEALAAALAKNEEFLNAIAQRAVTLHAQRLSS
jgi:N-acetyl-anhydromuramyl-L-alanine amidase AmpD